MNKQTNERTNERIMVTNKLIT